MKSRNASFKLIAVVTVIALIAALLPALTASAASSTLTLKPSADAYVTSNYKSTNYGGNTTLRVDMSPTIVSYLKFTVSGLNGASITSATLRVYGNSLSSAGYAVKNVADTSWGEKTITYNNAPAIGTTLGKSGSFSAGRWTQVNVSAYIKGAGTYSLALVDLSTAAINLASRESGANSPQLVLTLNSTTTASATPTKTSTPSTQPTPTSTPSSGGPQPYGVPGSWTLKWSDEFSSSSLDLNKWRPNWLGSSNTAVTNDANGSMTDCTDPAMVSVVSSAQGASGVLRLHAQASNGFCGKTNRTGMVQSYNHYTPIYGFFEARIWFPVNTSNQIYNWPTWWLDTTGTWPQGGEIDIMEGLGGCPAANYHWGSNSNDQNPYSSGCWNGTRSGWHTYAVDWEPGSLKFYYDGKLFGSYSGSNVTSSSQFLILSNSTSKENTYGGPPLIPADMYVDYVRVWQH